MNATACRHNVTACDYNGSLQTIIALIVCLVRCTADDGRTDGNVQSMIYSLTVTGIESKIIYFS